MDRICFTQTNGWCNGVHPPFPIEVHPLTRLRDDLLNAKFVVFWGEMDEMDEMDDEIVRLKSTWGFPYKWGGTTKMVGLFHGKYR